MYRYSKRADVEVVALLASALAYGRVRQIEKSVSRLFECMGKSPSDFVRSFDSRKRAQLKDFKHRFTTGDDISDLLELLGEVYDRFGSIEQFFEQGYDADAPNIIGALTTFCDSLYAMHAKRHDGRVSRGLKYLLASPARGSACKRLNLYLRWMVRKDAVDPGGWDGVPPSALIVPLDTHIAALSRRLGLTQRKSADMAMALEITAFFRRLNPEDPVKYDFALCHLGVSRQCPSRRDVELCASCVLKPACIRW